VIVSYRLALGAIAALVVATATATPALAVPRAGDDAPAFSLATARGGNVGLAAFKGKPLYVNFFASWCAPCNEEAPDIVRLYREYHKRGLAIVGVDELEDKAKAAGFAQKYGWPFAIAIDADGGLGQTYGAIGLPVHIFIDKRGKISTYRLGEMEPAEIEDAIKKIL
jgi:peroxiredoxin